MIEVRGNLWTFPADVRVITTNGTVKKNGECVMGRGCALEAKQRWPNIAATLGLVLQKYGNHVQVLRTPDAMPPSNDPWIFSFPVKHQWFQKADVELIRRSAEELVIRINVFPALNTIVMPRPGCGNGHLRWEDVGPILAPILDDRFHVITF